MVATARIATVAEIIPSHRSGGTNMHYHPIHGSLDPHESLPPPNGISIGSAVVTAIMTVSQHTDTQLDRQTTLHK